MKQMWWNRIKLLAVLGLFIFPAAFAAWQYRMASEGKVELGSTAHGELLAVTGPEAFSARSVGDAAFTAEQLQDKWHLIFVPSSPCDTQCLQYMVDIRQVWASLARERHRVQRVFWGGQAELSAEDQSKNEDMLVIAQTDGAFLQYLDQLPGAQSGCRNCHYLFDPFGNAVMRFTPEQSQDGVLKDIKKLLKASRIG